MYPNFFKPTTFEIFDIGNKRIEIPKCVVFFEKWSGEPLQETFGGKPVVMVNGKPMFAEIAIMQKFIDAGWQARWIETYGKSKTAPIHLSTWTDGKYRYQVHDPIEVTHLKRMLQMVSIANGNSFSGCWDVLAWKDGSFLFTESKRTKKDSIRNTQVQWLAAGLNSGLQVDNFLVVQWDISA